MNECNLYDSDVAESFVNSALAGSQTEEDCNSFLF